MFRVIAYLLISVVLISLLRSVIGVAMKAIAGFFSPPAPPASAGGAPPGPRAGGELKRDPVCGTFIPVETAVKRTIAGEVIYFCSESCRDKHHPG